MSQPIRDKSDDIMSESVQYLMQDITTPPQSVCLLSLHNLLGNMGPTIVKAILYLDMDLWARVCCPP